MLVRSMGVVIAGALAVGALAGCSTSSPPAPRVRVVAASTSSLENIAAVEAARAASVALAKAQDSLDFDSADLRKTMTYFGRDAEYARFIATYVTAKASPRVETGPAIWSPTSVAVSGDLATVVACEDSKNWYRSKSHKPSYQLGDGVVVTFQLIGKAPHLQVSSIDTSKTYCTADGPLVARFSPAPSLRASIARRDVTAPKVSAK
jgi:hypothetical protein